MYKTVAEQRYRYLPFSDNKKKAMDDDFSEIGNCANLDLKPIYTSDPQKTGLNLSCSCSAEFCYLCTYIDSPRGPDSLDLNAHIKTLIAEGKEIHSVARAVKQIYDQEIRAECVDEHGNTNPEWSLQSITRHLLHSNKNVFELYTESVLQHLIVRQSQTIVDGDGRVDGEERKALLQSIEAYNKWKARLGVASRKRLATDMS